jgi:hypothetical protein
MEPVEIRALWQTGHLHAEQLPELATDLLAGGADSLPLRQLAGLMRPSASEAGPLLDRALCAVGVPQLSRTEACEVAASSIAARVLDGAVDPYTGASSLAGLWSDCQWPSYLLAFVAALDEWDDFPAAHAEIEGQIRNDCRELLTTLKPREVYKR